MRSFGICAFILLLGLAGSGCGSEDEPGVVIQATPGYAEPKDPEPYAEELLDRWKPLLVGTIVALRARGEAFEQGDAERVAQLDVKVRSRLKRIRKFGAQARSHMVEVLASPVAKRSIAAGDAWAEWAHELLTRPPRNDFKQARKIADLAATAVRATQLAYESAGLTIPAAFRTTR